MNLAAFVGVFFVGAAMGVWMCKVFHGLNKDAMFWALLFASFAIPWVAEMSK